MQLPLRWGWAPPVHPSGLLCVCGGGEGGIRGRLGLKVFSVPSDPSWRLAREVPGLKCGLVQSPSPRLPPRLSNSRASSCGAPSPGARCWKGHEDDAVPRGQLPKGWSWAPQPRSEGRAPLSPDLPPSASASGVGVSVGPRGLLPPPGQGQGSLPPRPDP